MASLDERNPTPMYDPAEHVELRPAPWDETLARSSIAAVIADTCEAWANDGPWIVHPDDDEHGEGGREPGIYLGAAGVILSLAKLRSCGYAVDVDLLAAARRCSLELGSAGEEPWFEGSYMLGPVGFELIAALLGDEERHERLALLIERHLDSPSHEIFHGAPGSLLAARFIHERTGDARFAPLVARGLEWTWNAWQEQSDDVFLWRQRLYDRFDGSMYGPAHGATGTAAVLLGLPQLGVERRAETLRRMISTAKALVVRDGATTNWPRLVPNVPPRWPVQWCHGAPGVVDALCEVPRGIDSGFDQLLLDGGETVWAAGAVVKSAGLCHGTAGNGYTFLKLHTRTGDATWLERARAFAMHALHQMATQRAHFGRPWPSLWTGDLGVALYLQACIDLDDRILSFDTSGFRKP